MPRSAAIETDEEAAAAILMPVDIEVDADDAATALVARAAELPFTMAVITAVALAIDAASLIPVVRSPEAVAVDAETCASLMPVDRAAAPVDSTNGLAISDIPELSVASTWVDWAATLPANLMPVVRSPVAVAAAVTIVLISVALPVMDTVGVDTTLSAPASAMPVVSAPVVAETTVGDATVSIAVVSAPVTVDAVETLEASRMLFVSETVAVTAADDVAVRGMPEFKVARTLFV